jgi:hypothetical protein
MKCSFCFREYGNKDDPVDGKNNPEAGHAPGSAD